MIFYTNLSTNRTHEFRRLEVCIESIPNGSHRLCNSYTATTIKNSDIFIIYVENNSDLSLLKSIAMSSRNTFVILNDITMLKEIVFLEYGQVLCAKFSLNEFMACLNKLILNRQDYMHIHPSSKTNLHEDFDLTSHQFNMMKSMSFGYQYKELATMYGITIGTVKQHLHKIYDKLNVNNKVEALHKLGLVSLQPLQ